MAAQLEFNVRKLHTNGPSIVRAQFNSNASGELFSDDSIASRETAVSEEFTQVEDTTACVLRPTTNLQDGGLQELFAENIAAKIWRVAVSALENNVSCLYKSLIAERDE
jgi:hypothetical protein